MEKRFSVSIVPEFGNVDDIRKQIARLCEEARTDEGSKSDIYDFCIAATEAMNNVVEHSKADTMEVEFEADGEGMKISLLNNGTGFDPTDGISMPALGEDSDLPEGGFGLAMIKELVDTVRYEYKNGKNVLTIEKRFSSKDREE